MTAPRQTNDLRLVQRLYAGALALGLLVMLGLGVDAALLIGNVRIGQAALDQAALAASSAVDVAGSGEAAALELRLADADGRPSAYTLAAQTLAAAGARPVALTDVVSDGRRVFVRGEVAAPTLFLRLFGLSAIPFSLTAAADLRPPPGLAP